MPRQVWECDPLGGGAGTGAQLPCPYPAEGTVESGWILPGAIALNPYGTNRRELPGEKCMLVLS